MGALGVAAARKQVTLPEAPSVDATIDLLMEGSDFFLRAKLDVTVPGIDMAQARELVELAHEICPYSKATRGNIEVQVNVRESAYA
jgi:osmotically inducible protein OsmC